MRYTNIILLTLALVVASGPAIYQLRTVAPDRDGDRQSAAEDATHATHDEQRPATVADEPAHAAADTSHEGGIEGYAPVEVDAGRVQTMGIKTERVGTRAFTRTLRTVGIVETNENRVAHVQTKFEGWIEDLYVDFVGKPVRAGQPLFAVYSPDLVASQEEYLVALENAKGDREGPMAAELERWSKGLVAAACKRLARWDIPADQLDRVEREGKPMRALTFESPVDGIVLRKMAVRGMNVEPGMDMFEIADLSQVWVQADVYDQDIGLLDASIVLGVYLYALETEPLEVARTYAFATLVYAEIFRSFSYRSETTPIWRLGLFSNAKLLVVAVAVLLVQPWSHHFAPLGAFLKSSPLDWTECLALLAIGALPLVVLELTKVIVGARAARRRPLVAPL
jgi:hypothetical protein